MSFQIDIDHQSEEFVVKLMGDLDINSSPEMKAKILDAYNTKSNEQDIHFNLKELDYLDSTGLGAFISLYKLVHENGKEIFIHHAKPNVRKLFVITELDQLFHLED